MSVDPEAVVQVPLDAFPGPALVVAPNGELRRANGIGRELVAQDPAGWDARLRGIADGDGEAVTRLPGPAVVRQIEWDRLELGGGDLLLVGRDVTVERGLREVLTESRARFKALVDVSSDFAWETGADGGFVFAAGTVLGYGPDDLLGRRPETMFGDAAASLFQAHEPIRNAEFALRRADGRAAVVLAGAVPLPDGGARGVCRDVTAERALESELARARTRERLFGHVVGALRDELDTARGVQLAAEALVRSLAASGCRIVHRRGSTSLTMATVGAGRKDGVPALAAETRVGGVPNGLVELWRRPGDPGFDADDEAVVESVAAQLGLALTQLDHQLELRRLSERDGLTGLYNRRAFFDLAAQRLRDAGRPIALLYVDLDNFKPVNDLHGHAAGDAVLQRVAKMLEAACRHVGDVAARIGGDEFILFLADTGGPEAERVAGGLLDSAMGLRDLSVGPDRPLGLSIGIAVREAGDILSVEGLIELADRAMYRAKGGGKHGFARAEAAPA